MSFFLFTALKKTEKQKSINVKRARKERKETKVEALGTGGKTTEKTQRSETLSPPPPPTLPLLAIANGTMIMKNIKRRSHFENRKGGRGLPTAQKNTQKNSPKKKKGKTAEKGGSTEQRKEMETQVSCGKGRVSVSHTHGVHGRRRKKRCFPSTSTHLTGVHV